MTWPTTRISLAAANALFESYFLIEEIKIGDKTVGYRAKRIDDASPFKSESPALMLLCRNLIDFLAGNA